MQATWSRYLFSTTVLAYGTDTLLDPTSPLASHPLLKGTGIECSSSTNQCCRSVAFWYGSGSADPYL